MSVFTSMDTARPTTDPGAEAERWFSRLRADDCTAEERHAFERWRAERPENVQAHAAAERAWAALDELAADEEVLQWRQQAMDAASFGELAHAARMPQQRRWAYALAASVVVTAVAAPLAWNYVIQPWLGSGSYDTVRGEQRTVMLDDGSRMILDTDTHLKVRFTGSRREIVLAKGEALFDVAPDRNRPFSVSAGEGRITATGTRFSVQHLSLNTEVTLFEGGVVVKAADRSEVLRPNDRLTFSADTWNKSTVDPVAASSWTTGKLIFSATPLSEVISTVNRYGPGSIEIGDKRLESLSVSGSFRIGQPQTLIRALESAFPIQAETYTAHRTVLRRRTN